MTLGATRKDTFSVVKLRKKHIRGVFIIQEYMFFLSASWKRDKLCKRADK